MDHICLTIMELLSMNVSINKVNDVIQTVKKRLTNKEIDKLPSKGSYKMPIFDRSSPSC